MPADPLRSRTTANRRRAFALVVVCCVPLGVAVGLLVWWGSSWPFGLGGLVGATVVVGVLMWWAAEPLARRALDGQPAAPVRHARLLNLVEG
ncbi:MAG: hypothetical protein ACRDZX_05555, partial [Acidimicrobiales bacterium]